MPKLFFHLRDGVDDMLDREGTELSPEVAPTWALNSARDVISHDALTGRINLCYRIDVEDEEGRLILSLPFTEAVEIDRPDEGR